jgi:formylglycine-generating enzyme required for sulfatase activity
MNVYGFRVCFFVDKDDSAPKKAEAPRKASDNQTQSKNLPKDFTNSLGMKFVWIPPGSFMMGSPKDEKDRTNDETQHKVTLTKGFYMGVHTVTQKQWQEVMGNNPSEFKGENNLPVDTVSWNDCQEFIKKLRAKDKDKKAFRLSTEAEWEYACRAGTTTPFHVGVTISTEQANYDGNFVYGSGKKGVCRQKTTPVGKFPANAWGLHDMHGNVFQWCQDWDGEYPKSDVIDPKGPERGLDRVLRGGCWSARPEDCRSACRVRNGPGDRFSTFGLRVCFSADDYSAPKKEEPPKKAPDKQTQSKDPPKNFSNSIDMKFVWIPAGSFMMGSPKEEKERNDDETQHKVTLTKGFYIGVYTVTQEQWQAIMGNNPSVFKGKKNLPVENVSWNDCQEFIKELRAKDKKLYRLPTEAEWEYSCRVGTKTPFYFGQTISTDQANYNGNFTYGDGKKGLYREKTTPVGSFPANAWGLHDMHGNLSQWCQDIYGDYSQKDVVDPQGAEKGQLRVQRGGSWGNSPQFCRSACRYGPGPSARFSNCGLRVCFFAE